VNIQLGLSFILHSSWRFLNICTVRRLHDSYWWVCSVSVAISVLFVHLSAIWYPESRIYLGRLFTLIRSVSRTYITGRIGRVVVQTSVAALMLVALRDSCGTLNWTSWEPGSWRCMRHLQLGGSYAGWLVSRPAAVNQLADVAALPYRNTHVYTCVCVYISHV